LVLSSLKKPNNHKKSCQLKIEKLSISTTEFYMDFAVQNPVHKKSF